MQSFEMVGDQAINESFYENAAYNVVNPEPESYYDWAKKSISSLLPSGQNTTLKSLQGIRAQLPRGVSYSGGGTEELSQLLQDAAEMHFITCSAKFKPMLTDLGKHNGVKVQCCSSDLDWGSPVRCAQMMFANCARPQDLRWFDNDQRKKNSPLGIHNFAYEALTVHNMFSGTTYNLTKTFKCLRELNQTYQAKPDLSVVIFEHGEVNLDTIVSEGLKESAKSVDSFPDSESQVQVTASESSIKIWPREVLVIVTHSIQEKEKWDADDKNQLKSFMRLKSFVGLVASENNQTYFNCGFIESLNSADKQRNQLIYLDPREVMTGEQ